MINDSLFEKYKILMISLKEVSEESKKRVVIGDAFFEKNVNFFVKSYLVNICTYLESFLQDLALNLSNSICYRIRDAGVPHNFILWRVLGDVKEKEQKFSNFSIEITKKDISNELSANPYKTIKLFKCLGVNLLSCDDFTNNKELVNSIVNKRNNIVHHNDQASDISFDDIIKYVDIFINYMKAIYVAVND
ncbi:HEPN domain-containing protein [Chromobacterium violaceum]|uniref:HEPN domain-containing protein n=1 Tax=Chromobacterium violaceum TaxID=536 RepID=UPI001CE1B22A|nr:HEPN domain-containing protein [Chromobacterium violaceum]